METSDLTLAGGGTSWQPVAYGTANGDLIELWRSTPPPGFSQRLNIELEELREEAAEATAACGATLIDADRVTVAGGPALRRVERLPATLPLRVLYGASLIVVSGDKVSVEVTVTCGDSHTSPGADRACDDALARARQHLDELTPRISPKWDTQSAQGNARTRRRRVGGKTTRRPLTELARARRATGLNQAEFAAKIGVSLDAVSQWERGRYGVDVKYFRPIAGVLGLSVAEVAWIIDSTPAETGDPGSPVWNIPVHDLPRRPCIALTGPAGVYGRVC